MSRRGAVLLLFAVAQAHPSGCQLGWVSLPNPKPLFDFSRRKGHDAHSDCASVSREVES